MSGLLERVAGAPITWGVCEVPGWGYQLEPERVLREAREAGLGAIELGPPGFLPADPVQARRLLGRHRLELAAGFLAAVLHVESEAESSLEAVSAACDLLSAAGAGVLVLAAATGRQGYEASAELEAAEWRVLAGMLERAESAASSRGVTVVFHPHYGTAVESAAHLEVLLERTHIGLCVDTGHLLVGGADPVSVVEAAGDRVRHVHLKDVDAALAARVRRRELSYHDAVGRGLYCPLGDGDVDVPAVVGRLEAGGYSGWYVLEQDTVLDGEPAAGVGPRAAAVRSLDYLAGVAGVAA